MAEIQPGTGSISADVTTLLSRLTAARAGYLDNINNAQLLNIPDISTLTAARIGYIDNINQAGLLQITAARAGYLDNINNAQLLNIPDISTLTAARIGYIDNINQAGLLQVTAARAGYLDNLISTVTTGTYNHPNDTNQNDVLEFAAATQDIETELDVNALAQTTTIREYSKIDGATYREISSKIFPTDFDVNAKGIILSYRQKNAMYKITMQSAVVEGAISAVPYRYITDDKS